MNELAPIGHNNPPDPIEDLQAKYDGLLSEVQNWTDGEPVTDEAAMNAVDALLKEFKTYRTELAAAGKLRTDPLHKAWKAEVAAVKVHTDDADRLQSALVAVVAPFKAKLAAEKERERLEAQRAAFEASRRAQEAIDKANAGKIDDLRAAAEAQAAAEAAQAEANAKQKDTVPGMRKAVRYKITDHKALLHYIAKAARDDMTAFIEEWARKNHKAHRDADGLSVWTEKEAF